MNFVSDNLDSFVMIAFGIYFIIRGFMILTTGKLGPREEAKLHDFSEKGVKRYKVLSAATNIIGGLLTIGISIVGILHLVDRNVMRISVLAILAVLIAVYCIIRNSCKKVQ